MTVYNACFYKSYYSTKPLKMVNKNNYRPNLTKELPGFSAEERDVWKSLFETHYEHAKPLASEVVLAGIKSLNINAKNIPRLEDINKVLKGQTGWNVMGSEEMEIGDNFFSLLSNKIFPITASIRNPEDDDHYVSTDLFDDLFGTVPLLNHLPFAIFLHELSKLALEFKEMPWAIELLTRVYRFTVKYGLIHEKGNVKVYGSAITTSLGEMRYSLTTDAAHYPFDVAQIIKTPFRKDVFQSQYWVIKSFDELIESIPDIRSELKQILKQPQNNSLKKAC